MPFTVEPTHRWGCGLVKMRIPTQLARNLEPGFLVSGQAMLMMPWPTLSSGRIMHILQNSDF